MLPVDKDALLAQHVYMYTRRKLHFVCVFSSVYAYLTSERLFGTSQPYFTERRSLARNTIFEHFSDVFLPLGVLNLNVVAGVQDFKMRGTSATLQIWFTLTITLLTANLFQGDPCDGKAVGDVRTVYCVYEDYVLVCGTAVSCVCFPNIGVLRRKGSRPRTKTLQIPHHTRIYCLIQV